MPPRNADLQERVTGCVLYAGGVFSQVLEGSRDASRRMLSRREICRNRPDARVVALGDGPADIERLVDG